MQDIALNTDILPTILAVNSSQTMQEEIKAILSDYCRVIVSSNAVDALNLIYYEKVSLLLLDIVVPQLDGIEMCRTVRNMSQFYSLPIIMLTARNKFVDRVKCKLAGANAYITKPCEPQNLCEVVSHYLYSESVEITSSSRSVKRVMGLEPTTFTLGR
ncbi:response regulator [Gloeocapsopsis crepidinum LEGE 06123]|uniref:Response regulator n=1 Tax=Gloeocapsopsis crepidinum LEGE 06123 TaxID=588587 RepID=A0ABR9UN90_9CHRO|nr:response regulator [Gloeocapsopsis crepidinum LEGE 06123]